MYTLKMTQQRLYKFQNVTSDIKKKIEAIHTAVTTYIYMHMCRAKAAKFIWTLHILQYCFP